MSTPTERLANTTSEAGILELCDWLQVRAPWSLTAVLRALFTRKEYFPFRRSRTASESPWHLRQRVRSSMTRGNDAIPTMSNIRRCNANPDRQHLCSNREGMRYSEAVHATELR